MQFLPSLLIMVKNFILHIRIYACTNKSMLNINDIVKKQQIDKALHDDISWKALCRT